MKTDLRHALRMAGLCRAVKGQVVDTTWEREVIDRGEDRCVVFNLPAMVVVVFRSSDNRANWISNMQAIRHAPGEEILCNGGQQYGKIHKGFYTAVSKFLDPAAEAIAKFAAYRMRTPVAFAGHSRGGPLAMLAAFALRKGLEPHSVTTFGAPRWCDKVMAREYDMALGARTLKFVNNNDVVPHLPPWRLGWQHVGRLAYIDRRGRIHPDVHSLPFWDRLMGRVEDLGRPGFDALNDHSGDNLSAYITPLEDAVGDDPV